jgi:hypothetical protein
MLVGSLGWRTSALLTAGLLVLRAMANSEAWTYMAKSPSDESQDRRIQQAKITILYIAAISAIVVAVLIYFGVR